MGCRMDRSSRKNVEKVGIMTNKQLVLLMYPDAECELDDSNDSIYYRTDNYIVCYPLSTNWEFELGRGKTRICAWKNAASYVNKRVINMLES
jgi:hypothetical protein